MESITDLSILSTNIIKDYIGEVDTAIDITLGNGYDTEKILDFVENKVYAFDIQKEAIDYSKKRLKKTLKDEDYSKIIFINQTHENIDEYCKKAQLIIGNLGYLPNFDHEIKTLPYTTLVCLEKSLKILDYLGILAVTSYLGHDRGKEHETLEAFFKSLDSKKYKVISINPLNQAEMSPKLFICQKLF
ncbi:MAG: class I SAM-dependent methyltransferase [Andreesenia angusta]|nr:class I SAM-dependent methyltransferase [Andreesenia angusta]